MVSSIGDNQDCALLWDISINLLQTLPVKGFLRKYYGELSQTKEYRTALDELVIQRNITEREREVIEMMIKGKSNKEIEQELFISPHTVKNHIYNVFQKTGVKSRHQLIAHILHGK